ncbi:MAG: hypothetical protein AAB439_01705 [Patescibacteria group bacterium]
MNEKSVAIIGYGYVGKAIEAYFKDEYRIVLYDPFLGYMDKEPVNEADLAVVCVPTPMQEDGSVDLSAIEETFAWLKTPLILIKSTVPPGTTEALAKKYDLVERLVFSPEYIGEGNYPVPFWKDIPDTTNMKRHSFFIFGGNKKATAPVMEFFKRVSGAHTRFMYTDSTTAEMVKYMNNSWLATKVTFVNEFYEIAEKFDVDYNALRELFLLDGRVGASHTLVYTDKRGFGGKCLPKDVNGIVKASESKGYTAQFLKQVLESNKKFREGKK